MGPSYRNRDRRPNRTGYVDHDVFEGLPVRHWRRDYVTVAPPPVQDTSTTLNDIWAIELPHGMPKDYHLLPQHSQDLLRGARSGRIYKRPAQVEEDEVDIEGVVPEKPEKKEDDTKDRGFSAKAWKQVPRHLEGPDMEYLAKRKKNIITIGSKPVAVPTVIKATTKRIDAAGNEYVQDVIVPHGVPVEGEIISQTEIPDPLSAAPALPVVPSPIKRKPTSKKRPKGPGRGRKKKIVAPTSAPALGDGVAAVKSDAAVDGVKTESDGSVPPIAHEDTDMQDGSAPASENEDSDDEEGDEEEGSVEGESPAPTAKIDDDVPPVPTLQDVPDVAMEDAPALEAEALRRPMLNLEDKPKSGSPLKQVAMSNSALASPLEGPSDVKSPQSDAAPIDEPPISQSEAPSNVLEAVDAPKESEGVMIPEVTEATDSTEVADVPEVSEISEASRAPEAPEIPEVLQSEEATEAVEAGKPSENLEPETTTEAVAVPESAAVPEAVAVPEPAAVLEPVAALDVAPVVEEPAAIPNVLDEAVNEAAVEDVEMEMQKEVVNLAPPVIPEAPPAPTEKEVEAIAEVRKEEEQEEEMLLDIIEEANTQDKSKGDTSEASEVIPPVEKEDAEEAKEDVKEETTLKEEAVPQQDKAEDFPDLLGDLEKSLGKTQE